MWTLRITCNSSDHPPKTFGDLRFTHGLVAGPIPDDLGDLLVLQVLRLERNNLSGVARMNSFLIASIDDVWL